MYNTTPIRELTETQLYNELNYSRGLIADNKKQRAYHESVILSQADRLSDLVGNESADLIAANKTIAYLADIVDKQQLLLAGSSIRAY
jgi:hypothetical protein